MDNNIPVAADVDLMRGLVGLSIIGVEVNSGSSSSRDLQSADTADADSVSAAAVDSPCCRCNTTISIYVRYNKVGWKCQCY